MPFRKPSKKRSAKKNSPSKARKSSVPKKTGRAKKLAKQKPTESTPKKASRGPRKKAASKLLRKQPGGKDKRMSDEIVDRPGDIEPVRPIRFKKIVKRPETISMDQWNLPVGMKANGQYTYLKDLQGVKTKSLSMATLSGENKKNLILKRITDNPNYPTRQMLGIGEVDKDRAIEEVQAETPAGKFIAESEQRVIQKMIDKLKDLDNG